MALKNLTRMLPEQAEALLEDCIRLRRNGWSYDQISRHLEIDKRQVEQAVKNALSSSGQESAQELRALEAQRLDRLFRAIWSRAMQGDVKAVDRCLRIIALRAEMFGLNAPSKAQLEITGSIQSTATLNLSTLSMGELDALEAILAKAGPQDELPALEASYEEVDYKADPEEKG